VLAGFGVLFIRVPRERCRSPRVRHDQRLEWAPGPNGQNLRPARHFAALGISGASAAAGCRPLGCADRCRGGHARGFAEAGSLETKRLALAAWAEYVSAMTGFQKEFLAVVQICDRCVGALGEERGVDRVDRQGLEVPNCFGPTRRIRCPLREVESANRLAIVQECDEHDVAKVPAVKSVGLRRKSRAHTGTSTASSGPMSLS
jgi:hypothetical protein